MSSLSTSAGSLNPHNFTLTSGLRSANLFWDGVYDTPPPGPFHNPVGLVPVYLDNHIFSGRVLDNFHARKNAGELLPMTSYLRFDQVSTVTGDTQLRSTQPPNSSTWTGTPAGQYAMIQRYTGGGITTKTLALLPDLIADHGIDPSYYVQKAASKCYSRGWDALTFLAEFHLVLRMFKGLLKNLGKLATKDGLVNAYLEGRYGWRILMYDLMDINEVIRHANDDALTRIKDAAGENFNYSSTETVAFVAGLNHFTMDVQTLITIGARGSIVADFTPSTIQFNPIVTAWELITLSFVVDWIWSVGQALNAISFLALSDQYTAAQGLYMDYSRTSSNPTVVTTDPRYSWTYAEEWVEDIKHYERKPITVPFTPSLELNLNEFKVLDLIALAMQFFK